MYVREMRSAYWRTVNRLLPNEFSITTTVERVPESRTGPLRWVEDNYFEVLNGVSEMKRKEASKQKSKGKFTSQGEPIISKYPHIEAYMGDCWYDDGKAREVGSLKVTLTGSGVALSLTDPDERATAFTEGKTIEDALARLEDALATGKDPWRSWPKSFGKRSN